MSPQYLLYIFTTEKYFLSSPNATALGADLDRMNNVKPLTPGGWFEEGGILAGGRNNRDMIFIPWHVKGTFGGDPPPAVAHIVLEPLGGGVSKKSGYYACFNFSLDYYAFMGNTALQVVRLSIKSPPGGGG